MNVKIMMLLLYLKFCACKWIRMQNSDDKKAVEIYLRGIKHIIQDNKDKIERFEFIKMNSLRSAPFEVGYLYYIIQEEFRRMVDRYNTTVYMNTLLHTMEIVLYLEEIEMGYWHIEHLANMLHEIERKYKMKGNVRDKYKNPDLTTKSTRPPEGNKSKFVKPEKKKRKKKKKKPDYLQRFLPTTKKRSTRWWWPIEYGWEIDYYW